MKTLLTRRDFIKTSAVAGLADARRDRSPIGPHHRARAVPADLGIACAKLPRPRMVPRREVRHLGALVGSMRAGTGRLVRAENVPTRTTRPTTTTLRLTATPLSSASWRLTTSGRRSAGSRRS